MTYHQLETALLPVHYSWHLQGQISPVVEHGSDKTEVAIRLADRGSESNLPTDVCDHPAPWARRRRFWMYTRPKIKETKLMTWRTNSVLWVTWSRSGARIGSQHIWLYIWTIMSRFYAILARCCKWAGNVSTRLTALFYNCVTDFIGYNNPNNVHAGSCADSTSSHTVFYVVRKSRKAYGSINVPLSYD